MLSQKSHRERRIWSARNPHHEHQPPDTNHQTPNAKHGTPNTKHGPRHPVRSLSRSVPVLNSTGRPGEVERGGQGRQTPMARGRSTKPSQWYSGARPVHQIISMIERLSIKKSLYQGRHTWTTQGPSNPQSKVNFFEILTTFGDKCPQNGSKNEHGIPPHRAFCGMEEARSLRTIERSIDIHIDGWIDR